MAMPMLCRPIDDGADIVVQSTTKFLNSHGNAIGGVIVDGGSFDWTKGGKFPTLTEPNASYHGCNFAEAFGNIAFILAARTLGLRALGPALEPMNAFLALNGMETLAPRMERTFRHVLALAQWAGPDPKIARVSYPRPARPGKAA